MLITSIKHVITALKTLSYRILFHIVVYENYQNQIKTAD